MSNKEDEDVYEIDNQKFKVITRTIKNAESIETLYKALSNYAIKKIYQQR